MKLTQRILIASLLALAACGFSPIYGSHGRGDAPVIDSLGQVAIDNIPDSNGQFLRNKLIDRMYTNGRPDKPIAKLSVSLHSSETAQAIQKDSTTSRSQLTLTADYSLTDTNGVVLAKGSARSLASYTKLEAQYGTVLAQRSAYERTLTEVAEQIVNRISLYYAEERKAKKEAPAAKP